MARPPELAMGGVARGLRQEWESHNRSFVALAAIAWKIFLDAFEAAKNQVPADQVMQVRYEDLVGSPVDVFRRVVSFSGLDRSEAFERSIRRADIEDRNPKWRQDLTERQQEILNDCLKNYLKRYGYEVG